MLNSLLDREDAFKAADIRTTMETSELELSEGIFLRDTPGLRANHKDDTVAYNAYKKANMILFVHTPNVGELHADELEAINQIKALFPSKEYFQKHFCLVLTFVDSISEENLEIIKGKIIEELNRVCALKNIPIFAISNSRYWKGKRENKQGLLKRSGVNELREFLLSQVDTWKAETRTLRQERIMGLIDEKMAVISSDIDMATLQVDELKSNYQKKQAQLYEEAACYVSDIKRRSQKYGQRSNMTKRIYEDSVEWLRAEGMEKAAEALESNNQYWGDIDAYEKFLRQEIDALETPKTSPVYQRLCQLQSDAETLKELKIKTSMMN